MTSSDLQSHSLLQAFSNVIFHSLCSSIVMISSDRQLCMVPLR